MTFYSLKEGLRNILYWFPIIWEDRDFDWEYLAKIMEWKFRKMSHYFETGIVTDSPQISKELLTCAELLKRLQEDDMCELYSVKTHMTRMKGWQEMLGNLFSKRLRTWWE